MADNPRPENVERTRLSYGVPSSTDVVEWARQHANGLRPDAMPYGIDRMTDHGYSVRATSLAPIRTLEQLRLAFPSRRTAPEADWGLAWDEHFALRMLARSMR